MKNCCLLLLTLFMNAQTDGKIRFKNPSFEDQPRESASPEAWQSFTLDSTPDILPGAWGVTFGPQHGNTCVGLVTRDDGTREDVGQSLPEVLKAGTCYTFSVYLAHAPKYVGYNHPTRLRIWGSGSGGGKEIMLASSPLIDHADWRLYKFQFVPSKNVQTITFEAYFAPGTTFFYKGNIVLDNCSAIERCDKA